MEYSEIFERVAELIDLDHLESQVDFRQFTMAADEYAAALFMDRLVAAGANVDPQMFTPRDLITD